MQTLASATSEPRRLGAGFFRQGVTDVARDLIGAKLTVAGVGGIIVEVEAYDRTDPASHAFRGPTATNAAMFGPPGHAYVYRSYGIHWCLNFVCGPRPARPSSSGRWSRPTGSRSWRRDAESTDLRKLCAGPGRVCQALAIARATHDGLPLDAAALRFEPRRRRAGGRGRIAHRPHQGRRHAVALRPRGLALS